MVLGHLDGPADYKGPHILFYGHYDVQPPDPLELWTSPPFEPQLVDGARGKRFVARGAVDDKGQTTMFLEALRAWHDAGGGIPAKLTVLIEGEEEVGSRNLEPFLKANKAELKSDIALISDTNMWDIDTPALTTSLRGLTYVQLTVKAAKRDLHSGLYGGSALNPINAITRIVWAICKTRMGGSSCRDSMTRSNRSAMRCARSGNRSILARRRSWAISA